MRALAGSLKVVTNAVENDSVDAFVRNTSAFVKTAKAQMDTLQAEFERADKSCKELAEYFVEDSLKEEPESFLSLVSGFVVSFEQADRFNQDALRLEAQKKKREEAAASKRESSAQKAKGSEEAQKQAPLTLHRVTAL